MQQLQLANLPPRRIFCKAVHAQEHQVPATESTVAMQPQSSPRQDQHAVTSGTSLACTTASLQASA